MSKARSSIAWIVATIALATSAIARADDEPKPVRVALPSSNHDVTLYRIATSPRGSVRIGDNVELCKAPCRTVVSSSDQFRIGGGNVSSSGRFSLPAGASDVTLDVSAGSRRVRLGGWSLIALGLVNIFPGAAFVGVGYSSKALSCSMGISGQTCSEQPSGVNLRPIGVAMISAGVVTFAAGIVLFATSGTRVKTSEGLVLAKRSRHGIWLTPSGFSF